MRIWTQKNFHVEFLVIVGSSVVGLVAFVALCSFCFKRKKVKSYTEQAYDNNKDFGKELSEPLLKDYADETRTSFQFLTSNESKRTKAATADSSNTSKASPGWGPKNIRLCDPPDAQSFDNVNIQPKNKTLSNSYNSLESSWSSIPPEPETPTDRGEDLGSIYFSISYDSSALILRLTIQKAVNLPAKDLSGTSDPFVKVLLLPDKKNKLETRVKRKKLHPIWNEVFTFEGFPHQKLMQRTVYLQVLDYDRFSRNDPIGEVELPLSEVHLQPEPVPFIKKLAPCKRSADYLGDLLVSMCYNPTSSRISIVVMKCSNLKVMDITGSCDPYVKIYLVFSGKRIDKKKTTVKRRVLNPVWNETFDFDVPIDKIREISFVLTVLDFDRILPNESIGQVIIGYRTAGTSLKHWTEMMNHPRKPIAMWHKIIKY